MRLDLEQRLRLFTENTDGIKHVFRLESSYMYPLCAYMFAIKNREVERNRLLKCSDIVKHATGIFSNFRGSIKMTTIANLALSNDPREKMDDILTIYDLLKQALGHSVYLTVIANTFNDYVNKAAYEALIHKTRELYLDMKEEHPFLTSAEDRPYAALLAMTQRNNKAIMEDMETCYGLLKKQFSSKNAVLSLCAILALDHRDAIIKCQRVVALYAALRAAGHPYGQYYELSTLGIFAMFDKDQNELVSEIIEVDAILKKTKGFGMFGIGQKQRLMYAGLLVASMYVVDEIALKTTAVTNTIVLIAAQQAAICAASATAAAAAASASSAS